MGAFSVSDAALTGFRVVRERPRAALLWAGFQLVFSVALQGLILATASPDLVGMMADPSRLNPAQASALLAQILKVAAIVLPFALAYYGILLAAMNRVVLRPADDRFAYLRLGADELRQLALIALASAVFFGIELVLALGAGLLIAVLGLAKATPASLFAPLILVYLALILVAVRFSLASALTFDRARVDLFGSWALTRGRFWPLFGTLLIAVALALVITLLGFVIVGAVQIIVAGGDLGAVFQRRGAVSASTFLSAPNLVAEVLNAGVTALVWPIMLTPAPEIYRQLVRAGGPV